MVDKTCCEINHGCRNQARRSDHVEHARKMCIMVFFSVNDAFPNVVVPGLMVGVQDKPFRKIFSF